jgi:hypothetical protein
VPDVTCPLASEPEVWLPGRSALELALSAVVVSTVAVLLLVALDEVPDDGCVPVAAVDVLAVPLGCVALLRFGRDVLVVVTVEGVVVVAVAVLPFVPETVAVLPFVPEADVTAVVMACAGKTSASAETRGSAYWGRMETSVGCSIHGSIGLHPRELPAPMGRSASVVVLGGPLAEAYARLFAVG